MQSSASHSFTIGRSSDCTYAIAHPSFDEKHLVFTPLTHAKYLLHNISERGNVLIDKKEVSVAHVYKYTSIQVGNLSFTLDDILKNRLNFTHQDIENEARVTEFYIGDNGEYLIGASPDCDATIPSPRLAWRAFQLQGQDGNWTIRSLHGRKENYEFQKEQAISIGSYELFLDRRGVLKIYPSTNTCVDLSNVNVVVKAKKEPEKPTFLNRLGLYQKDYKTLAKNLSLSIRSGEFVGIVGPSGAGKSVLLKTIRGIIRAKSGQILLDQQDARTNRKLFQQIGFIPQDDVVYPKLTVEENLRFAAALRLPSDWPKDALDEKADELIQKLYLEKQRDTLVENVSGGQRKRVNLATELILEPEVLLADEVCSGLSSWDTQNVIEHLREIADDGKIVLLTIHTPDIEALELMDMLLVYDVGGFISYYGPAYPDAMRYFSSHQYSPLRSPKLIFDVLEKRKPYSDERKTTPEEWGDLYRNSRYHQEYIAKRFNESCRHIPMFGDDGEGVQDEASKPGSTDTGTPTRIAISPPKSATNQIFNLTYRRVLNFLRDKSDPLITFGQAPLMAFAFFFVFQEIVTGGVGIRIEMFQRLRQYPKPGIIIFLGVLAAVWFGFSKAISEIPASRVFFQQERLSFLKNVHFIVSRFISLCLITLGQVLLFAIVFHSLFIAIPDYYSGNGSLYHIALFLKFTLLLWIISIASVSTAMFISVFIRSPSAANAILPFIIILQILFGGSLIQPLKDMNNTTVAVSNIMISRWGFEAAALLFEKNLEKIGEEIEITEDFIPGSYHQFMPILEEMDFNTLANGVFKDKFRNKVKEYTDRELLYANEQGSSRVSATGEEGENNSRFYQIIKENDYRISSLKEDIPEEIKEKVREYFLDDKKTILRGSLSDPAQNPEIWNWMVKIDPEVQIFRQPHAVFTWFMLLLIAAGMLFVLCIVFSLKHRR